MQLLGPPRTTPIRAALFDFDGTLSTLRYGWEQTMAPMMEGHLLQGKPPNAETSALVAAYIDQSTGIQTIYQMQWLAEQVQARHPGRALDPWAYKAEYNRRLMADVGARRDAVVSGQTPPDAYLVAGSVACLDMLRARGVTLYVASGTDEPDVRREAQALGLSGYFARIAGAPEGRADCSKEAVIADLIEKEGIPGEALAVIGDGKVEIALGRARGARTLGVASDEQARRGINPQKQARLVAAGASAIVGDFLDAAALEAFFFGKEAR